MQQSAKKSTANKKNNAGFYRDKRFNVVIQNEYEIDDYLHGKEIKE